MKKIIFLLLVLLTVGIVSWQWKAELFNVHDYKIGQEIDSLDHVIVYYNGEVGHVLERNVAEDGYNIGLKYQCVEFVKRYYYEHYKHKMPDSYGNAKDFFDAAVKDGSINKKRNLRQFSNPGKFSPEVGDLIVFDGHSGNPYGHVAIVSEVKEDEIQIIQQNPGPGADSRVWLDLTVDGDQFKVDSWRTLGWLRMR
jgi:surface antigen